MMTVNIHRGEVLLVLDDVSIVLAPTFAVLAALEGAFQQNLIALAEKFSEGKATLSELFKIIQMAGGDHAKNLEAQKLVGKNYLAVQKAVAEFFAAALGVGAD